MTKILSKLPNPEFGGNGGSTAISNPQGQQVDISSLINWAEGFDEEYMADSLRVESDKLESEIQTLEEHLKSVASDVMEKKEAINKMEEQCNKYRNKCLMYIVIKLSCW